MMDLLQLNKSERAAADALTIFFEEAYTARARNVPWSSLKSSILDRQARRLLEYQQLRLERWSDWVDKTAASYQRAIADLEQRATNAKERMRRTGREPLASEKRDEIRNSFDRMEQRGLPSLGDDAKNEIARVLGANPEREIFELQKKIAEMKQAVAQNQDTFRARATEARATLETLAQALNTLIEHDELTAGALYQFEYYTTFIACEASFRFHVATADDEAISFLNYHRLDLNTHHDLIRAWATRVSQTPDAVAEDPALAERLKIPSEQLKKGIVFVPWINELPVRALLATAYLPIHKLQIDFTMPTQQRFLEYFYDSSVNAANYPIRGLNSRNPQAWALAISRVWTNVYILLGGSTQDEDNVVALTRPSAARVESDAIVRALFLESRLQVTSAQLKEIDWSSTDDVINFLWESVLFNEDKTEGLISTDLSHLNDESAVWQSLLPSKNKIKFTPEEVAPALARLLHHPKLKIKSPAIKAALERHRGDAVSTKLAILRTLFQDVIKRESAYRPGDLIPF